MLWGICLRARSHTVSFFNIIEEVDARPIIKIYGVEADNAQSKSVVASYSDHVVIIPTKQVVFY